MTRNVQQIFYLHGKTALITGGSRGLGLQMAHALGEAGARMMLSARKASDLEEAVAELRAAGIDAQAIAADCSREEETRGLSEAAIERLGGLDILVSNAGASWCARSHLAERPRYLGGTVTRRRKPTAMLAAMRVKYPLKVQASPAKVGVDVGRCTMARTCCKRPGNLPLWQDSSG